MLCLRFTAEHVLADSRHVPGETCQQTRSLPVVGCADGSKTLQLGDAVEEEGQLSRAALGEVGTQRSSTSLCERESSSSSQQFGSPETALEDVRVEVLPSAPSVRASWDQLTAHTALGGLYFGWGGVTHNSGDMQRRAAALFK